MAINKTAKNLYVTLCKSYDSKAKKVEETAEKVEIVATKENLKLLCNKKIVITGTK